MSIETRLAALRMQARELERTPCQDCGHPLLSHSRVSKPTCKQWSHRATCKCGGFVDLAEPEAAELVSNPALLSDQVKSYGLKR